MAETDESPRDKDEEEHEEGEISDEEPPASPSEEPETEKVGDGGEGVEEPEEVREEPDNSKEVPLLHRRVSLDDLVRIGEQNAENRKRLDFYRHDTRGEGGLDEDGHERKAWVDDKAAWRRDGSSFTPNGAYGSNLYNFAWAQAVSGRPSFPTSGSPKDDRTSGSSPGFGEWAPENVARDYSREMEMYRRGSGRSSEERDDLSPIDNGRTMNTGRLGRMRSVEKETWAASERRLTKGRIGRVEREEEEDSREFEEEDRRKRSESGSPSGKLDELTESSRSSPETTMPIPGHENDGDDREEGELEEGEIELPLDVFSASKETPDHSRHSSKLDTEHLTHRSLKDKYSGKLDSRSLPKPYSRSQNDDYSRRSRQSKSEEYERERRFTSAANLVKNVTVKDAQKSFIDVCERLHKALRLLDELHSPRPAAQQDGRLDPPAREVTALARQAFAGIRAVYAVRNTASGREQERDKNMFPRLLELANGYCQKLFTSKQTRELEVMMQTMASSGRFARDSVEKSQYPRDQPFLTVTKKNKEKDGKQRETLVTSFPTTRQQNISESKETNVSGRILGFVDAKQAEEAAAIAAAALAYAQSSAAARSNSMFGSTLTNRSGGSSVPGAAGWGWFPENGSHFLDPATNSAHADSVYTSSGPRYQQWSEGDHRPAKPFQDIGILETSLEGRTQRVTRPLVSSVQDGLNLPPGFPKHGNSYGMLEEDWEELSPPGAGTSSYAAVAAGLAQQAAVEDEVTPGKTWPGSLPSYPKNVGMSTLYSRDRLPSPTPDDENEDDPVVLRQPFKDVSSVSSITESFKPGSHPPSGIGKLAFANSLPGLDPNLIRSHSLDSSLTKGPKMERPMLSEFTMLPSPTRSSDPVEPVISLTYTLQGKGHLKSRDPRRRMQHSSLDYDREVGSRVNFDEKPIEEEVSVGRIDMKRKRHITDADETDGKEKRQKFRAESDKPREFEQDNAHGTGGWLDDNLVATFPLAEEGPIAMEVDEEFAPAGLQDSKGFTVGGDANGDERSQQDLSNGLDHNKKQKSDLGQQAGDLSQRRMKPRDPRRLLLENNVERDVPVGGGDVVSTADLNKGTEVGLPQNQQPARVTTDDQASNVWNNRENGSTSLQVTTLPNIAPHFMEKLTSLAGMVGTGSTVAASAAQIKSPHQSVGFQVAPATGSSDLSGGKSSVEALALDSILRPDASGAGLLKASDPQLQKASNLEVGPRKPKGTPGQWGASQVHPGLEKLLEDLSESERRAVQQERERRMEEQDRMFSAGKLCLVLDLDHTLLNSAKFSEIEPEWEHRLRIAEAAERSRTNRESLERRELYRFPHMSMWTKLRPGIWKFLARASQLFELHVYTMGNKVYATEMAKLLDPSGALFEGRVISKGDDGDGDDMLPKSKDLDGVLGMESAVIIIDDSARVWPHHSQNLIVVERYMYFPCSRRQFGLGGPSLLEVGHDEREADGMIASVLSVVDRIHKSFFENQRLREVDVRDILASEQRQVLAGCKVVFSRIFPVGEAQPHLHPLWRTAEQFGAICTTKIDDEVTHVVAISPGTDKVNWALSTGRHVVRPAWLEASTILYRRANERDFFIPTQ
ncbi:RNA polymerase II C-terminal domain phosphatase-like 3/4 [Marchantia polymorpha subsp. ruderalis]|uniref:protein-serine/threonine phosphatase n=2 Tax=Marchantia polymorpha TaxID=3197 RepID=A0A176WPF6_MARPO|nr:hypothetical protein AXG93_2886s1260 [Marchantia polymorpha subsp. ruderalis]PTQ29523.1 hypothetical protein MARPO_0139s0004 [Marchantia polymorpha]BBN00507.1 hypothetical protein Mp_1g29700 [Marchantia polymorpha subsp. ruderalis]|eukprot:PTQ29523.1 hypothetical protein MARPO_0139s0004 [Marchantia polymorpha]